MNLKDLVLGNQKIIELVKDRTGGKEDVDMYYGTLDYATSRFHTILLKLSQDELVFWLTRNDLKNISTSFLFSMVSAVIILTLCSFLINFVFLALTLYN